MGVVFVDLGLSLDGFIAGPNARPGNPLGDGGMQVHEWMFRTRTFNEKLLRASGGETGEDDRKVRETLEQAKKSAGVRDVRVSGGADVVRQALAAGVVEELVLHLSPLLLGGGMPLFDGPALKDLKLEPIEVTPSATVTHLRYRVG